MIAPANATRASFSPPSAEDDANATAVEQYNPKEVTIDKLFDAAASDEAASARRCKYTMFLPDGVALFASPRIVSADIFDWANY